MRPGKYLSVFDVFMGRIRLGQVFVLNWRKIMSEMCCPSFIFKVIDLPSFLESTHYTT